jgi:hypothetical protein
MNLSAERLQRAVALDISREWLAGSESLRGLAIEAYRCVQSTAGNSRAVAYALHHFLDAAWSDHDRVLEVGEADKFMKRAASPIQEAADFILTGGDAEKAVDLIIALSAVEDELLPHLTN